MKKGLLPPANKEKLIIKWSQSPVQTKEGFIAHKRLPNQMVRIMKEDQENMTIKSKSLGSNIFQPRIDQNSPKVRCNSPLELERDKGIRVLSITGRKKKQSLKQSEKIQGECELQVYKPDVEGARSIIDQLKQFRVKQKWMLDTKKGFSLSESQTDFEKIVQTVQQFDEQNESISQKQNFRPYRQSTLPSVGKNEIQVKKKKNESSMSKEKKNQSRTGSLLKEKDQNLHKNKIIKRTRIKEELNLNVIKVNVSVQTSFGKYEKQRLQTYCTSSQTESLNELYTQGIDDTSRKYQSKANVSTQTQTTGRGRIPKLNFFPQVHEHLVQPSAVVQLLLESGMFFESQTHKQFKKENVMKTVVEESQHVEPRKTTLKVIENSLTPSVTSHCLSIATKTTKSICPEECASQKESQVLFAHPIQQLKLLIEQQTQLQERLTSYTDHLVAETDAGKAKQSISDLNQLNKKIDQQEVTIKKMVIQGTQPLFEKCKQMRTFIQAVRKDYKAVASQLLTTIQQKATFLQTLIDMAREWSESSLRKKEAAREAKEYFGEQVYNIAQCVEYIEDKVFPTLGSQLKERSQTRTRQIKEGIEEVKALVEVATNYQ